MVSKETLFYNTPLLESPKHFDEMCNTKSYMKMEYVQPSGSYKIRGMSNLVKKSVELYGIKKLVSASGGNAGMATAYAGKILNVPTTVVIPESTPKMMIKLLENEKANVLVHGSAWDDAHEKALQLTQDDSTLYVHPFHHPLVWEGNESIVEEILNQCPVSISAIVLSVGGGGLLCGVLQALQKKGLEIPVVAMETEGAHCLNAALKEGKPVDIGKITSIAKTLGALKVSERVFELLPKSQIISEVVSDKQAVEACIKFADTCRALVEPSCGATLAAGYSGVIQNLVKSGQIKGNGAVVFIVCGGNAVSLSLIEKWKKQFDLN